VAASQNANDSLTIGRVAGALVLLVVLAFVLPFAAVRTLYARRLEAADRDLKVIAGRVQHLDPPRLPSGTEVLTGPGPRPRVTDERWNSAASLPLSRVLTGSAAETPVDPWGNAYLVMVSAGRPVWVMSAGADGIVQTRFDPELSAPAGDDRAVRIRPR
jgi:hypothetical protein